MAVEQVEGVSLSLFKIPFPARDDGDETVKLKSDARKEWLRVILRTRENTPELKKRINENNIFLCELHFKPELIYQHAKRKTLETGAVPTQNLPSKSHDSKPSSRRSLVREISGETPSTSALPPVDIEGKSVNVVNESFEELVPRVKESIALPWVMKKCNDLEIRTELWDNNYSLPKFVLHVDKCLQFSLHIFNWLLPDEHSIYTAHRRRITSAGVVELLQSLQDDDFLICEGLHQHAEYLTTIAKDPDDQSHPLHPSDVVRHSIPKSVEMDTNFGGLAVFRCVTCQVLVRRQDQGDVICEPCKQLQRKIVAQQNRSTRQSSAPAKDKAPLTRCSADKLRGSTVVESRVKCSLLEAKVKSLQVQIKKDSITVSETLEKDVLTIMGGHNLESTPHMKFFWEQQVRLRQANKFGRRFHPQVIRFALSIHCKSASAYRELRDSGALILPSERVLRDYRNYFKPGAGITKENVEELKEKASKFSGIHKYVAVIMDEMKIQENLVFDKTSGELIGFIDLGDPLTTFANTDEETPIASHALAFLVRGLCTNLKHVVAYYFTGNVTSFQLLPLFWKVVGVLETTVKLWVIAAVNDGASPNRKFFALHAKLGGTLPCGLVYKTPNLFVLTRMIYFFADVPHLIKITRNNCLYNSGYGSHSRYVKFNIFENVVHYLHETGLLLTVYFMIELVFFGVSQDVYYIYCILEHIWIEISGKNKNSNVLLGVFYQPDSDPARKVLWLEKFETILAAVHSKWDGILAIAGDMNIDLKNSSTTADKYEAILRSFNLNQHIKDPTCKGKWLIDHIITNIPHNVVATGVLPTPEVSDHDMPYVIVNARLSRFETRFKYIRTVKSFCSEEYLRDISELPFSLVYAVDDPDEKITILN
ncbi:Transposable element P transposase [Paramuricea clavata]|uniref:Transposable element P transposase n=1 Tax=Paramuricea clavata TaxID=317549 RepID=A0A6S7LS67_PARCT|nr:Transposable element P transposase [Paramuricea clavata]